MTKLMIMADYFNEIFLKSINYFVFLTINAKKKLLLKAK